MVCARWKNILQINLILSTPLTLVLFAGMLEKDVMLSDSEASLRLSQRLFTAKNKSAALSDTIL